MNAPAILSRSDLWYRRVTDFVGLLIVSGVLMEFCSEMLGVHDNLALVVLTLACVSDPLLQLVRDRRAGERVKRGTQATAVLAAAPWIVLGWLHTVRPGWWIWQSMPVPAPMRYVGCAVAVIVIVVRPVLQRGDDAGGESLVPRGTWESQLLVASVLLVSGSAVAALLAVYWLAVSGVQRLPQLLHAVDAAGQCGVQPVSQG